MLLLPLFCNIAQYTFGLQSIRTYSFVVQPTSVSFGESLPAHTQLFNTWPQIEVPDTTQFEQYQ